MKLKLRILGIILMALIPFLAFLAYYYKEDPKTFAQESYLWPGE